MGGCGRDGAVEDSTDHPAALDSAADSTRGVSIQGFLGAAGGMVAGMGAVGGWRRGSGRALGGGVALDCGRRGCCMTRGMLVATFVADSHPLYGCIVYGVQNRVSCTSEHRPGSG